MSRSWEITYESKKNPIMVRRKIKKHKETTEYFRIKKKKRDKEYKAENG